ncbi:hypothetical protein QL285_035380 [Trifolium repens]|nr:hypothetical protein QL285_035380 [Trifolium repens]
MWNPLSHLSHNISNLLMLCDKCDNGFHMKCVRPIVVLTIDSHTSCENHYPIYCTIAAHSIGRRSHVAHNDVNVHHHHHHHIPYPRHYIRHQRLLLKLQRLLQVVCRIVDEADELHRRRRSMRSLEPLNRKI